MIDIGYIIMFPINCKFDGYTGIPPHLDTYIPAKQKNNLWLHQGRPIIVWPMT